jgi:hypothetical protein
LLTWFSSRVIVGWLASKSCSAMGNRSQAILNMGS